MGVRHPEWIRAKAPAGERYIRVKSLLSRLKLNTVCQSAHCPNIGECWHAGTATFMILGDVCTRACRFCAVTNGKPEPVDQNEPARIVEAVRALGLKHVVITSVTRDDLSDGGASQFAAVVSGIHESLPECSVEVLIPDFQGSDDALMTVLESAPEILNHNIETVKRLYPLVRPQAIYERSLNLIRRAKEAQPNSAVLTKSGIMVGVGEMFDEVVEALSDLREVGCDIVTIGQYLRPSPNHIPIERYYEPAEFEQLKKIGIEMGFKHVESAPLVRSSYHAEQQAGCCGG